MYRPESLSTARYKSFIIICDLVMKMHEWIFDKYKAIDTKLTL